MTIDARGLDFKEAVQEALAEEAAAAASPESSTAVEEPDNSDALEVEQPTVESHEDQGLFTELVEQPANEQPHDVDSLKIGIEYQGEQRLMTLDEVQSLISELEAGNMMKADYTRKTQETAELRKEAEKALILWNELQGPNGVEVVRKLWQRINRGDKPVETVQPQPQVAEVPDIEALIEQKLAEKLASDPRIQAYEQDQALQQLETVFASIEDDYNVKLSDADKQLVLEEAAKVGVNSTDGLYLVFEGLMQRKQRRSAGLANAQATATVKGQRGEDSSPELEPEEFKSWREAMAHTLRQENLLEAVSNL